MKKLFHIICISLLFVGFHSIVESSSTEAIKPQGILDQSWDFSNQERWQDYEVVTSRLNSPELVNYYERMRFIYKSKKGRPDGKTGDPKTLFKTGFGNCSDHASFTAYCLKKAGYKTKVINVHPSSRGYHAVCQFKIDGKKYIIDNGRPDKFLRRGVIPSDEYAMYQDPKDTKSAQKDPVSQLQSNSGLALIYLMEQKNGIVNIYTLCKDLGLSGYENNVEKKYFKGLVENGFVLKIEKGKSGNFSYTINEPLCVRFKKERYNRPQNALAKW
ncbi:MAG: hypothetical protein HQ551_02480 [Desulfobacteraceae bacterium]|nr:hypothetical protein [Desulfobacteraceae bacterium]